LNISKRRKKNEKTHNFSWSEVRPPPSRGIGGATVVALATDSVCQFSGSVVCVDDMVALGRLVTLCLTIDRSHIIDRKRVSRGTVRGRILVRGRVRLSVTRIVVWRVGVFVCRVCVHD
jgi:hypothetical protein